MDKKKEYAKKLRTLSAVLGSSLIIGGCNAASPSNVTLSSESQIAYETDRAVGTISQNDLKNKIRMVRLKNEDDSVTTKLVIKEVSAHRGRSPEYFQIKYLDLENGSTVLDYKYMGVTDENSASFVAPKVVTGENIELLQEDNYASILKDFGYQQKEYDVSEMLDIFYNEILPNLESQSYKK